MTDRQTDRQTHSTAPSEKDIFSDEIPCNRRGSSKSQTLDLEGLKYRVANSVAPAQREMRYTLALEAFFKSLFAALEVAGGPGADPGP